MAINVLADLRLIGIIQSTILYPPGHGIIHGEAMRFVTGILQCRRPDTRLPLTGSI